MCSKSLVRSGFSLCYDTKQRRYVQSPNVELCFRELVIEFSWASTHSPSGNVFSVEHSLKLHHWDALVSEIRLPAKLMDMLNAASHKRRTALLSQNVHASMLKHFLFHHSRQVRYLGLESPARPDYAWVEKKYTFESGSGLWSFVP